MVLCIGVFLLCSAAKGAGGKDESEQAWMQAYKTELKFDEWVNRTKEGREILVLQLNVDALLPEDVSSRVKPYEASFPSYRVACSRSAEGEATLDMTFEVRVLPSMREARELMLKYLAHLTAPLSYLRELWAKDKPPYGDVSFGRNFWSTGNLFFILDNRRHERFVDELFGSIDGMLRAWPQEDSEIAAPDHGKDVAVRARYLEKEQEWELNLEKLPKSATVVLSSVNWETRKSNEKTVRMRPKKGTGGGQIYWVVLEKGKQPRYVHVPVQKDPPERQ